MKINKLKAISIMVCCFVASLWSKNQAMEEFSGKEIKRAYQTMRSINDKSIITDNDGNQHEMKISGVDLGEEKNKNLPTHIITDLQDDGLYIPNKNLGRSTHVITLVIEREKMVGGMTNSIFLEFKQVQ